MQPLKILEFYSKCKAPTKEELEMRSLGFTEKEYNAYKNFREGKDGSIWFLITSKNYVIG